MKDGTPPKQGEAKSGNGGQEPPSVLRQSLRPGVTRREVWAWAMYDFANSGYTTVVLTTVFSAYFVGVVAEGKAWGTLAFTAALSLSYLLVMLTMPVLGARADARAGKRRLLFTSTVGCVVATALLSFSGPGDIIWGLVIIAISNYCYCVGESIVAAFLPEIAQPHALGRVSGWGWSFGYFGGMLTLGLSLGIVSWATGAGYPASEYVGYVMLLTAAVFAVAAVPSFLFLRERSPATHKPVEPVAARLRAAWRDTSQNFPDFRLLLFCGACYHAGISVVITLSAVYATQAMGFTMAQTMLLVFTVNIAAAIGAFLFGYAQDKIGHKVALSITLVGWVIMILVAFLAIEVWVFWIAATLAGLCMGTSQSAGRAMVGALAPQHRLAEFYSLWTFATQLAAVVGPLCYGLVTWVTGGNHRLALLFTGVFFVAGLVVLSRLDFSRGAAARNARAYTPG
ncbi:MFS transporter [Allopusillimonas ginsengisoli]|uniref:MFS transporter n=1 Tax=Allopusillimonas ginsengisoli TaxID=453575 RepID=UPI0039C449D0